MKSVHYLIVTELNGSEKFNLLCTRNIYLRFRKKIIRLDKTKNKKKNKTFPVFNTIIHEENVKVAYVVYGTLKQLRIEKSDPPIKISLR